MQMGLLRAGDVYDVNHPKPERKKHKVTPIVGEHGRFTVESESAKKRGRDEAYIVDIFQEEETTAHGKVIGTCACKGFSVRGTCSHLTDAKEEYLRLTAAARAEDLGLENLDDKG
jgi:hypothetical protein